MDKVLEIHLLKILNHRFILLFENKIGCSCTCTAIQRIDICDELSRIKKPCVACLLCMAINTRRIIIHPTYHPFGVSYITHRERNQRRIQKLQTHGYGDEAQVSILHC